MRILVTGAAGFVGRVFLHSLSENPLLNEDIQLFLVQNSSRIPENLISKLAVKSRVKVIRADLTEEWRFSIEVDQLINLAADGQQNPYSEQSNYKYLQINQNLVSWASQVGLKKIVHISSGICDYLDQEPIAPILTQRNKSNFAKVRKVVENILEEFTYKNLLECKVLRLYSFVGSEFIGMRQYAVNQFIESAKRNGLIRVLGNSQTKRSYLLDCELGAVITQAVLDPTFPNKVSIASTKAVNMQELAEIVAREVPARIEYLGESNPIEDYLPIYAKTILPRTSMNIESLDDTIRRLIREFE